MQLVPGTYQGTFYLLDDKKHQYLKKYDNPPDENGVATAGWRCYKARTDKCPAMAYTMSDPRSGDSLVITRKKNEHNHIPNLSLLIKNSAKSEARAQGVADDSIKPRALFSNLSNMIAATGEHNTITPSSLSRAISRDRIKQVRSSPGILISGQPAPGAHHAGGGGGAAALGPADLHRQDQLPPLQRHRQARGGLPPAHDDLLFAPREGAPSAGQRLAG